MDASICCIFYPISWVQKNQLSFMRMATVDIVITDTMHAFSEGWIEFSVFGMKKKRLYMFNSIHEKWLLCVDMSYMFYDIWTCRWYSQCTFQFVVTNWNEAAVKVMIMQDKKEILFFEYWECEWTLGKTSLQSSILEGKC